MLTGTAGMVAGGISMAFGEYTSVKTQNEQVTREVATERAELAQYPDDEADELSQRWIDRGLPAEVARSMARALRDHPDEALRMHVFEELGVSTTEKPSQWVAAFSSLLCFAAGAIIPLLPYILGATVLWPSLVAGAFGLVVAGVLAARFTGRPWWFGGGRQLLLGAAATTVTYLIGLAIGVNAGPG